ncbi:MAG TPA: PLP-dependent aspartate aminotransferase family protein [Thermoanaerobaculia bacterium]|nr:PLP-dependent aspartate aminotransferase family protein [Thermoanaerobaculia bacterium]
MSYRPRTLAIHAGQPNDERTGAVTVPIYQTSTFEQSAPGVDKGYSYARTAHPTREALERCIAELEGSEHGLAYASGMAAINGVLASLSSGDRVVSTRDLYGGAWRIFTKVYRKLGIEFAFVDTTDTAAVAAALSTGAKLLWLETPSNPLLKVTDIRACASLARQAGALTVVDNTFATPILQQPLSLGADIVVHSTTKYINGHSDTIGGAIVVRDRDLHEHFKFFQNAVGAVPGPQDCFLTLRGIKTLPLRVAAHCEAARRIATFLEGHPAVSRVYYPGLSSHPGHELARRQMSDFGAIISVELDADLETTRALTTTLPLWTLAESLGGVKSLLCHPPTMTHAAVEPEVRREVGIADGLLRLSVGLEDPDDLIESLEQGLDSILAVRRFAEVQSCAS